MRHRVLPAGAAAAATITALTGVPAPANAGLAQPTPVSSTPVKGTPNLKTGSAIHADAVIRGVVYAGGRFTQFTNGARTITYNRNNLIAYSASTGAVLPLHFTFNGDVMALAGSADGTALYVGGAFTTVNGRVTGHVVKVRLATGAVDRTFRWSGGSGAVEALQFKNSRLYAGGAFAKRLMAVNPTTGADTRTLSVSVTGRLDSTIATKVTSFAINPASTELVAVGNFTTVNGHPRRAAFKLRLWGASAVLMTWHPSRFNRLCPVRNWPRDVDWSPDGHYFVIVGSGARPTTYPLSGFCDAAGRWEATSTGAIAQPTWINWTGGDSLYSVAVSGSAVYVGGHNRWLDNPYGHDTAGPGAYRVDSIGAIYPATGKAIRTWNARYMDREHGKEDLTLFPGGLVVGGDGTYLKGFYHRGTGIFPVP